MLKHIFLIVYLILSPFAISADWQHTNPAFDKSGIVTIKTPTGTMTTFSNNGQQGLQSSASPTVLSVNGGTNYKWVDGLLLSDGFYYVYEEELGIYVRYSSEQFTRSFTAKEENVIKLPFQNTAKNVVFNMIAGFSCGNDAWAANNNCTITRCDVTFDFPFDVAVERDSCHVIDRSSRKSIGGAVITRTHQNGFYYQLSSSFDFTHELNIPIDFKSFFGNTLTVNGSGGGLTGASCSDASVVAGEPYQCTGASTNRSIATAGFSYYFTKQWNNTDQPLAMYLTQASNSFVQGKYLQKGQVYDLPFSGIKSTFVVGANESGSVFYTTINSNIYSFSHGSSARLVMGNTNLTVKKALVIQSYKSPTTQ